MKAILIGGSENGKIFELRSGDDRLMMLDRARMRGISFRDYREPYLYPEAIEVPHVVCDTFKMRIGNSRTVTGIRHPEISTDTAVSYLADLVMNAWEASLKDRR